MGLSAAFSAAANEPSPWTTTTGRKYAARPWQAAPLQSAANPRDQPCIQTAVSARRGASSDEGSPWKRHRLPRHTHDDVARRLSCSGFLTAKAEATAKAENLAFQKFRFAPTAAASREIACRRCDHGPCNHPQRHIWKSLGVPVRAAMALSKPIRNTATGLPCPSTTALVAKLWKRKQPIAEDFAPGRKGLHHRCRASFTPMERSPFVVSALPAENILRVMRNDNASV